MREEEAQLQMEQKMALTAALLLGASGFLTWLMVGGVWVAMRSLDEEKPKPPQSPTAPHH
jgi:hypothetical protein